MEPERISPKEVYEKLGAGAAILVCAYEDDEKFRTNHLEGAISLKEFKSNLPSLSKDRQIVFYCACPGDAAAAGQAAKYIGMGYKNAKVLLGRCRRMEEGRVRTDLSRNADHNKA